MLPLPHRTNLIPYRYSEEFMMKKLSALLSLLLILCIMATAIAAGEEPLPTTDALASGSPLIANFCYDKEVDLMYKDAAKIHLIDFTDDDQHICWTSSDESIATVREGKPEELVSAIVQFKCAGTVTITGELEGYWKSVYEITATAPSVKIKKAKSTGKKKVTVSASAEAAMVKYQVAYRPAGTEKWKVSAVTPRRASSVAETTIGKLKSKQHYELRIRGQFISKTGKKYYTAWSKMKTVKVK